MEPLSEITRALMDQRFGKDSVIALATADGDMPYVRYVNAYYQDGAFYIITHALSGKMRQMARNSAVAIAGDWFTARGIGENLGYIRKAENLALEKRLREVFAEWIDNGHNQYEDVNTCILRVRLTEGVLFSHGIRYDIDFAAGTD
jgi:hypothetical protein